MSSSFELSPLTQEIDVIHGQLYIADCKDEGNTLEPYLPEKKTVVVLKTCAWTCVGTQLSPPLRN